jgi:uroporphyrinogen-III decarboxylase
MPVPPYLPPRFFREYVVQYDRPIVDIIKRNGGFPRIHCHGKIKEVLDDIVSTGCIGLDPIEPHPQGNVSLSYVRENYGDKLVFFGNLELSDIETMEPHEFEKKILTALEEGTAGEGKGFVLMPTASPIGRKLKLSTLKNYEKIIELAEKYYY